MWTNRKVVNTLMEHIKEEFSPSNKGIDLTSHSGEKLVAELNNGESFQGWAGLQKVSSHREDGETLFESYYSVGKEP